jgi:phosphotransferase system enzyme I (PtsI)
MYQEFHPAVLRAIKQVVDVGHAHGIWVGICGEMAGDVLATLLLLGLGLDEFSVVPSILPEIKKIILLSSRADAEEIARRCLSLGTAAEIRGLLSETMSRRFPDFIFTGA